VGADEVVEIVVVAGVLGVASHQNQSLPSAAYKAW